MIVAIDVPAASGKGTLARRLAVAYGLAHLDSGLLYRAAAWRALAAGADPDDPDQAETAARAVVPDDLARPQLRGDDVARAASKVAAIPGVRAAFLEFQRRLAHTPPGAVIDGRDIGTVVCPDAEVKMFVTADVETRADRRFKELRERGEPVIYAAVLRDMKQRDDRDSRRAVAPLVPAVDAFVLDSSGMDADEVYRLALDFITDRTGQSPPCPDLRSAP